MAVRALKPITGIIDESWSRKYFLKLQLNCGKLEDSLMLVSCRFIQTQGKLSIGNFSVETRREVGRNRSLWLRRVGTFSPGLLSALTVHMELND